MVVVASRDFISPTGFLLVVLSSAVVGASGAETPSCLLNSWCLEQQPISCERNRYRGLTLHSPTLPVVVVAEWGLTQRHTHTHIDIDMHRHTASIWIRTRRHIQSDGSMRFCFFYILFLHCTHIFTLYTLTHIHRRTTTVQRKANFRTCSDKLTGIKTPAVYTAAAGWQWISFLTDRRNSSVWGRLG